MLLSCLSEYVKSMSPISNDAASNPKAADAACSYEAHGSYAELLEARWEELVIKFDSEEGRHVVRTACCPMHPVC